MIERYSKFVTGKCGLCGREREDTQMHHIVSQRRIRKASRDRLNYMAAGTKFSKEDISLRSDGELRHILIHEWPENIIEVCKLCHDLTESSESFNKPHREIFRKTKNWKEYGNQNQNKPQCKGISNLGKKNERRCRVREHLNSDGLCFTHRYQLL